jgi:predicted Fe-S protein YdhL (DUF1289 family)
MIESPCVQICTLDARSGICLGCGRTVDEIAGWIAMSGPERSRVMKELPARLATTKSDQSRNTIAKTATG